MKIASLFAITLTTALLGGCGSGEIPYKPRPAYTGEKPSLPTVPTLPNKKKKEGNAYTVWGATHDLRSIVHRNDFAGKKTTLVGWIVKTNYADAPECAVHKTGKGDPPDCKAPVPSFWIADSKDEKEIMISVMGWASNYAQIFTLIEALDKDDEAKLADEFFGVDLPSPLPNDGARVKVTGSYGINYTRSTKGTAADPKYGIMTPDKIEYLTVPPMRAVLPGMKIRNKTNK